MVHLVALLQPTQDRHGVLHRWLAHHHRLEAPLQGGVLLDVLAVLIQRGGADRAQLTTGEHGLQQVGGIHRPLGLARAHDRVQLVDEEDDLPLGVGDLLEHGLEAVLELPAVLGARDQAADVERDDALAHEALRHVAIHDALGEPLDDRGLADPGLADEHGVVLGAARQHLDDPAHLLVTADDRVELPLRGGHREVAAVLLQGLVLLLGVGVGHAGRSAHLAQRGHERLTGDPVRLHRLLRGTGVADQREQQVLGADVLVGKGLGLLAGVPHHGLEGRGELPVDLRAADGGAGLDRGLGRGAERGRICAGAFHDRLHHALRLVEEREQEVLGLDQLVPPRLGEGLGRPERLCGTLSGLVYGH